MNTDAQREGKKALWGWALYDWANSAFTTTVMAGFFPVLFKQHWSAGSTASESTLRLGLANSAASLLVAAAAPLLGALADRRGKKKRFLIVFAGLGALMTAALSLVGKGDWLSAALIYTAACVGYSASVIFYDSLIVSVVEPEKVDRASALGYALGYLGGGLLFALNVLMAMKPQLFGLRDATHGVQASFVLVAIWWGAFTIPLARYVREPKVIQTPVAQAIRGGFAQLMATLRRVRTMREVWLFLLAYWLYIDGVDTVIRMAVDYGVSIGLPSSGLTVALLITQFVGFPCAILFGRLGEKIGAKRGILLGIGVYLGVTVWGSMMTTATEFYALAAIIGMVQGGVQALSRSLYSRLIPPNEAGEFFGFYNMLGKFAAIVGPALMGIVAWATGSARVSILSLLVLFLGGGALLLLVDDRKRAVSPT